MCSDPSAIHLQVHSLGGNLLVDATVESNSLLSDVKDIVEEQTGISFYEQSLLLGSTQLLNTQMLGTLAAQEMLQLTLIRRDRDQALWLELLSNDGLQLENAPESRRSDRELVLAAVTQCGSALRFATMDLRADFDIVLQAVKNHGDAFLFASSDLRIDKDIVSVSLQHSPNVLNLGSPEIAVDQDCQAKLSVLHSHIEKDSLQIGSCKFVPDLV